MAIQWEEEGPVVVVAVVVAVCADSFWETEGPFWKGAGDLPFSVLRQLWLALLVPEEQEQEL